MRCSVVAAVAAVPMALTSTFACSSKSGAQIDRIEERGDASVRSSNPERPPSRVLDLAAGLNTTCAIVDDGEVRCWGDRGFVNASTDAFDPETAPRTRPTRVDLPATAASIAIARDVACAALDGAAVHCWGMDVLWLSKGHFGTSMFAYPKASWGEAIDVSVRGPLLNQFECYVHADGTGNCHGEIEHATSVCAAIGAGCWIDDQGAGWCQGSLGWELKAPEPMLMHHDVVDLACETGYGCLVTKAGLVKCWGDNELEGSRTGIAARGEGTAAKVPVAVRGLTGATDVATGPGHACAVYDGGHVACWGGNHYGELGARGGGGAHPRVVAGLDDAVRVEAGETHTCALRRSGELVCWGRNQRGQLGDGTTRDRAEPGAVRW